MQPIIDPMNGGRLGPTLVGHRFARSRAARLVATALMLIAFCAQPAVCENFLILLADDLGVDGLSTYARHPEAAPTPNIDALAARGVTFTNAWSHMLCSPSRASLLTGLLPTEHGISRNVQDDEHLATHVPTFADLARLRGYDTFAVGKWHVSGSQVPMTHPLEMGFRHHAGPRSQLGNYFRWTKYVDGNAFTQQTTYATTDAVDETLARIANASGPWLAYVAFNAPHGPFHAPPAHLHGYQLTGRPENDPIPHFRAAIEALDTEIGRLFASIPPEVMEQTSIIFAGDNGTPRPAVAPPADPERAKGTPYRGGVEVPLIFAGPLVPVAQRGTSRDQAAQLEDIHATIVDRLGRPDLIGAHAHSLVRVLEHPFLNPRQITLTQHFSEGRDRFAAQEDCYKLIRPDFDRDLELYDRCADPEELAPIDFETATSEERRAIAELDSMMPYRRRCNDGLDNDGDGLVDELDPGCENPESDREAPACNDGIDNDGDGLVDFGGANGAARDPECTQPFGRFEDRTRSCGLGFEIAPMIALMTLVRRRRAPVISAG